MIGRWCFCYLHYGEKLLLLKAPARQCTKSRRRRTAVKHVFTHEKRLTGLVTPTIGLARATKIALANHT